MSRQEVEKALILSALNRLLEHKDLLEKEKVILSGDGGFQLILRKEGFVKRVKTNSDQKSPSMSLSTSPSLIVAFYGDFLNHNELNKIYKELSEQTRG